MTNTKGIETSEELIDRINKHIETLQGNLECEKYSPSLRLVIIDRIMECEKALTVIYSFCK